MTTADLIITNANVYTVDSENPTAEAVATRGNEIIYVGSTSGALSYQGEQTRVVDGRGRTLIPGIIDSHFHLKWGSESLAAAQLEGIYSLEDLHKTVQDWAASHPNTAWVQGNGLSYGVAKNVNGLTRHHLDQIVPDRPLILYSFDLHTAWINTPALELCGLLQGVEINEGDAAVVMGDDGLATGELVEPAAYELASNHIPKPTAEEMRDIIRNGLTHCASLGITSIQNMDGSASQMAFYHELEQAGELTMRINMPFWLKPDVDQNIIAQKVAPLKEQYKSDLLRCTMVKFFMDGVYESYSAMSLNAYPGRPDHFGEPIFPPELFTHFAIEADKHGFQIAVHACGDGAVQAVLDGYEAVQARNGRRDSRHRVEHIEVIADTDVPRFAELGVIASMQPKHCPSGKDPSDIWRNHVSQETWNRSFAWRTLREANAHIALGSDWPVVTCSPFVGMASAVNRRPWLPDHKNQQQTLEETIAGYTKDGAYAEFQEDKKGQIKVGMWADLALLSTGIFAIPSDEIGQVTADMTICNGRVVHDIELT